MSATMKIDAATSESVAGSSGATWKRNVRMVFAPIQARNSPETIPPPTSLPVSASMMVPSCRRVAPRAARMPSSRRADRDDTVEHLSVSQVREGGVNVTIRQLPGVTISLDPLPDDHDAI